MPEEAGRVPSVGFRGTAAPPKSPSQTSGPQNWETRRFCWSRHPVCGALLQRPWETHAVTVNGLKDIPQHHAQGGAVVY